MLDAFQDEQGGKEDRNGEQDRRGEKGGRGESCGDQVVSFVSIFVNLHEEPDFHSE